MDDSSEPTGISEPAEGKPWAGRGAWVWGIGSYFHDSIEEVIQQAQALKLQWITLKIADDGSLGEPIAGNVDNRRRYRPEEIQAIKDSGLRVVGWVYAYGSQPSSWMVARWVDECRRLGLDGLIIDAEAELRNSGAVLELIGALTDNHEGLPLAVAPLPIPQYHRALMYQRWFDAGFDVMFQVYENDLGRSWPIAHLYDIYEAEGWPPEQIYPVYGAYEGSVFTPTRGDYANFFREQITCNYPGSSIWRLDTPNLEDYLGGLEDANS